MKQSEIEFAFSARGIQVDHNHGIACCVCNQTGPLNYVVNGFVKEKGVGELIVSWFNGNGSRLDYYEQQPNWISVQIGFCSKHWRIGDSLLKRTQQTNSISYSTICQVLSEK